MSKSIMSNEKVCYICGAYQPLHKHHIYGGYGRRQISEEQGCWVYLCLNHHTGRFGVHNNSELDYGLKRMCQQRWEYLHGSRDEFRKLFGKSYVE